MLDVYRRLAALRRELPELTDPSFERTRCTVDEDDPAVHDASIGAPRRRRGRGQLRHRAGHDEVDEGLALLFETESGVDLDGARRSPLPAHAGALLAPY